ALPIYLPLQLGNDERRRRGGAGRDGNDRHGGRTCTADVLVRQVEDVLVVRVGVHGRHEAPLETERVAQDLDDRDEAVRRAAGVADDVVRGVLVLLLV